MGAFKIKTNKSKFEKKSKFIEKSKK